MQLVSSRDVEENTLINISFGAALQCRRPRGPTIIVVSAEVLTEWMGLRSK